MIFLNDFRCHYQLRKNLHDTGSALKMIRLQEKHTLQKEKKGMINCNASLDFVGVTFIQLSDLSKFVMGICQLISSHVL